MEQKRDLAIVLRSIAYEERHRIVTALTEQHGLISALARNAVNSRRFGGTLELFSASEWMFVEKPGADLHRLEQAQIRRSYEGLRKDFDRLSMAGVFSELILKIAPKGEPCPELFRLHSNALACLEETPITAAQAGGDISLLNGYFTKILQWSGSQPQIQGCLSCQTPIDAVDQRLPVSCIVDDAGWICARCRTDQTRHVRERHGGQTFHHSMLRVMPAAIRDFQMSLGFPIRQIPALAQANRKEHQELFRFLEALFIFHMPGFDQQPLKSLRFLDIESSLQPSKLGHL